MKKKFLILTAALSVSVLLSACSKEDEGPSELDMLIEQLQTTNLNNGAPTGENGSQNGETADFKSMTGSVVSFDEKSVTVKADGQEQKFTINEETQILGGDIANSVVVTVSYDERKSEKRNKTADVITVVKSANENGQQTDLPEETTSQEVTETYTAENAETLPPEQEITPESSETVTETSETEQTVISDTANSADSTDTQPETIPQNDDTTTVDTATATSPETETAPKKTTEYGTEEVTTAALQTE